MAQVRIYVLLMCTAFASSFALCQWRYKYREWLWTHSQRLQYCHHKHNVKVDLNVDANANLMCEQGLSIYIPVQSMTRFVWGIQLRENHCMCRRFPQVTDPHLGSFNIRCVQLKFLSKVKDVIKGINCVTSQSFVKLEDSKFPKRHFKGLFSTNKCQKKSEVIWLSYGHSNVQLVCKSIAKRTLLSHSVSFSFNAKEP